MTLQEAIRLLSQDGKMSLQVARVIEVTGQLCTVDFEDGRPVLGQVRLKAVIDQDDNALLVIPKVGSYVLVSPLMGNSAVQVVCVCSEVERLELKVETTRFTVDKDGLLLGRQGDSLRSVLGDLIDAINAITVPTGTGPSGVPINAPAFNKIKDRIHKILKDA
jgi:hypothetical protein